MNKVTEKKKESVDFGNKKEVVFVSNGKSKHMPKGNKYTIGVDTAKSLIEKGYGEVK